MENTIAVTTKEDTAVAVITPQTSWLQDALPREDVINGTLCIVSAQSSLVVEGKAKPGDIIDSTDSSVVVPALHSQEMIVTYFYKEWEQRELDQGNLKLKRRFPYSKENQNLPEDEIVDGKAVKNFKCLTFLVLLPGYSPNFPMLIRFKKSNYFVGRNIVTALQKAAVNLKPHTAVVFKLMTKLTTWNAFKWHKFEVTVSRDATDDEKESANKWWSLVNSKADEVIKTQSEVEDTEAVPF